MYLTGVITVVRGTSAVNIVQWKFSYVFARCSRSNDRLTDETLRFIWFRYFFAQKTPNTIWGWVVNNELQQCSLRPRGGSRIQLVPSRPSAMTTAVQSSYCRRNSFFVSPARLDTSFVIGDIACIHTRPWIVVNTRLFFENDFLCTICVFARGCGGLVLLFTYYSPRGARRLFD